MRSSSMLYPIKIPYHHPNCNPNPMPKPEPGLMTMHDALKRGVHFLHAQAPCPRANRQAAVNVPAQPEHPAETPPGAVDGAAGAFKGNSINSVKARCPLSCIRLYVPHKSWT